MDTNEQALKLLLAEFGQQQFNNMRGINLDGVTLLDGAMRAVVAALNTAPEGYVMVRAKPEQYQDIANWVMAQGEKQTSEHWQLQLADALDCAWNPAVMADRNGEGAGSAIAGAFAAVAQRLREQVP